MKSHAIDKIKRQPYFKLPDFRPLYCYSNKVLMAAAGEIGRIESVRFITINWRDRVRRQPFYGQSKADAVKFRRPVSAVIDDVIQDSMCYGLGISRIDPRDTWDMTIPVYTLEDICWNKMLDNAVLSK